MAVSLALSITYVLFFLCVELRYPGLFSVCVSILTVIVQLMLRWKTQGRNLKDLGGLCDGVGLGREGRFVVIIL